MKKINQIKDSTRKVEHLIVSTASDAIWGLATSKIPFLAWPIVSQVCRFVLDKALYWMSEEGIIWFNSVWIGIHVSMDAAKLEEARQLAILGIDQGLSEEELDELDQELIDAFNGFHRVGRAPL